MDPLIGRRTNVRQPIISSCSNSKKISSASKSYHTLVSPTPTAKEHERVRKYDIERCNSILRSSPINSTQCRSNSNPGLRRAHKILGAQITSRTSPESFKGEVLTPQVHLTGEGKTILHDHVDSSNFTCNGTTDADPGSKRDYTSGEVTKGVTNNAIATLSQNQAQWNDTSYCPVLQILKLVPVNTFQGTDAEIYRYVLSDGTHLARGIIATQLNTTYTIKKSPISPSAVSLTT